MSSRKLTNVLNLIAGNLERENIAYSLIGAYALNVYGLPRFTADIDLIAEEHHRPLIRRIMERLGYTCFQETNSFAQFDSELGVMGRIDFMFVHTPDGIAMLTASVSYADDLLGRHPVIRPTDYVILKLLAVANNPGRSQTDEKDIVDLLKLYKAGLLPDIFGKLDMKRIRHFAERFGQAERIESLFDQVFGAAKNPRGHKL